MTRRRREGEVWSIHGEWTRHGVVDQGYPLYNGAADESAQNEKAYFWIHTIVRDVHSGRHDFEVEWGMRIDYPESGVGWKDQKGLSLIQWD